MADPTPTDISIGHEPSGSQDVDRNQHTGLDSGVATPPSNEVQATSSSSQSTTVPSPVPAHGDNDDSSMPARWWYAQTAFPLCAGTFGPMANAFSICALVENWRVSLAPGSPVKNGTNIPDPKWLIAINAVSLACALTANMSLLLNMAKRVSFSVAQTITIVGFWISSVLLIGLIAAASHGLRAPGVERQALTQAYYYACWAAGIYQIISYLMCITVYGALTGKYEHQFKLTTSQRTLMLQTISFLTYLLLGALVFSRIEGWEYLDAVYWADFTLLTVGIGDYSPSTHLGRGLLFPFGVGGIVVLGLVVSSIRSLILDRGKQKLSARMTEKIRRSVVRQIHTVHAGNKKRHAARTGVPKDMVRHIATGPVDGDEEELERRRIEFEAMRNVQHFSERRQKWVDLSVSVSAWAMLWFFGALVFSYTERDEQQWSYFVSVYFAYTSLLTIGYGDFSPTSNSGKAFFVVWSLLAVPSLTIVISDMSDTVVRFVKDATIWLGEVTILPSDEGSIRESLAYGFSKATRRLNQKVGNHLNEAGLSTIGSTMSKFGSRINPTSKLTSNNKTAESQSSPKKDEDQDETDRMARAFEKSEKIDEHEARLRSDKNSEDEHHERHLLLSAMRSLYADSHLKPPKQYSYTEWVYFLRLLGQDERSSDHHQLAMLKSDPSAAANDPKESKLDRHWSWIGPDSPLTSEKHEPALLLELFFEKLGESLRGMRPPRDTSTSTSATPPATQSQTRNRNRSQNRSRTRHQNRNQNQNGPDTGSGSDTDTRAHSNSRSNAIVNVDGDGDGGLGENDNDDHDPLTSSSRATSMSTSTSTSKRDTKQQHSQ